MDPKIRAVLMEKIEAAFDEAFDATIQQAIAKVESAFSEKPQARTGNVISLRPASKPEITALVAAKRAKLGAKQSAGRPTRVQHILNELQRSGGSINMGVLCKRIHADFATTKAALDLLAKAGKLKVHGQGVSAKVVA